MSLDVNIIEKPVQKNDIEWEYIVFDPFTHEYIDIRTGEVIPELSYITEEAYYNLPTTEEEGYGYNVIEGVMSRERELYSTHRKIASGSIPRELVEKILEEYRGGTPVSIIAEKYGINMKMLYNIIRSQGEKTRQRRVTQELQRRILELYGKGYSISQISRELGISKSTVHRIIKKSRK